MISYGGLSSWPGKMSWPHTWENLRSLLRTMVLLLLFLIFHASPSFSHPLFYSRDALVSLVIDQCRGHVSDEQDRLQCYSMLRCIMANVPIEYTARWSAGANILAFVPTIVGLMSNSIDEIALISDESPFLAIALALSSITAFNSRFGDWNKPVPGSIFDERLTTAASMNTAIPQLRDLLDRSQKARPIWQHRNVQSCGLGLIAITLGAGVWYVVAGLTTYGIVVFACPIKVNIGIWVGLSQLLALINVLCRKILFKRRCLRLDARNQEHRGRGRPDTKGCRIVLQCPCHNVLRQSLKIFTAFASFSLYAYGTVLLASTTLVPASDAIRAMVVVAAGAGFGRLAAHFYTTYWRTTSQTLVLEVAASYLAQAAVWW